MTRGTIRLTAGATELCDGVLRFLPIRVFAGGGFVLLVATTATLVFSGGAAAAPGDLDPAFGVAGKLSFPVGPGTGSAQGVVVQGDGKIVAIGPGSIGSERVFAVTRYNPDGSRDPSFQGDGEVLTNIASSDGNPGSGLDQANAVALQADGTIVVAGYSIFGTNRDFSVVRYLSNGSPG